MSEFTDLEYKGIITEQNRPLVRKYKKLYRICRKLIQILRQNNLLTSQDIDELRNEI